MPGTTRIENFASNKDSVRLDLSRAPETIVLKVGVVADGTMMSFLLSHEGPTKVEFRGLDTLPIDDVLLRLTDRDEGETYEISLTDAIAERKVVFDDDLDGISDPIDDVDPETVELTVEADMARSEGNELKLPFELTKRDKLANPTVPSLKV